MYRVLLVEDEEIIRKGIRYSVPWEEYGCSVVAEAENGAVGEEKIAELRPDIVITDITMPVKSGLEMIADTREEYKYIAIILTGYSEFEYAQQAIQNALELIRKGELPISQIGWECGIGEYKYFNHVFKKYMGCSVREYQSTLK